MSADQWSRIVHAITFLALILFTRAAGADTARTSPKANSELGGHIYNAPASALNPTSVITFSEFPLGTTVSDQYADRGIVFAGDAPFISIDGANPTAPVLSGTPQFQGAIEGRFVDPRDGTTPVVVAGFSLDAGYFDAIGSVRLAWYGPDGSRRGQLIASVIGIQTLSVQGGEIASWRIETIMDEPAGFAIDNVSIEPIGPSLIFREQSDGQGFWARFSNYIPGFDHVGLQVDDLVYESNVPHSPGTYVDRTGTQEAVNDGAPPACDNGVQFYHKKATFEWDALSGAGSNVSQIANVSIPSDLAASMRARVLSKADAGFYYLPYVASVPRVDLLIPRLQKGGGPDGEFTCVGLVEWAAESSGYNGGEGFIKNAFESFDAVVVPSFRFGWPPVGLKHIEFGLLSPELLYWSTSGLVQGKIDEIKEWIQGLFDPVDFMLTDPLGRRFGHTSDNGDILEIPRLVFSGSGIVEQFLVVKPVPGVYKIEFFGVGDAATVGIATERHGVAVENVHLEPGETRTMYFVKEVDAGGMGDVDGDGDIDEEDEAELVRRIPAFAGSPNDPGDLDGDGELDEDDLSLLVRLREAVLQPYPDPEMPPVSVPAMSSIGLGALVVCLLVCLAWKVARGGL